MSYPFNGISYLFKYTDYYIFVYYVKILFSHNFVKIYDSFVLFM